MSDDRLIAEHRRHAAAAFQRFEYEDAEKHLRGALTRLAEIPGAPVATRIDLTLDLAGALKAQGRFAHAHAMLADLAPFGVRDEIVSARIRYETADVLAAEGRHEEARGVWSLLWRALDHRPSEEARLLSARAMRRVGLSAWADQQRDTGGAMIATAWSELRTLLGEADPLPASLSFHVAVPPRIPHDAAASFAAARERFLAVEPDRAIPESDAQAHLEGLTRLRAGDFPSAASRLREALLGMEAALGSESLAVLARLPQLAAAYHGAGKDREARLVWDRARARLATAQLDSVLDSGAPPPDTPRGKP